MKSIVNVIFLGVKLLIQLLILPVVVLLSIICRLIPKNIDIGIGPVPLINNIYWKKALKKKGYNVETFVNDLYYITDEFDFLFDRKHNVFMNLFPICIYLWAIFRYKVLYIYFNGGPLGGVTIYRYLEPYLYKISGTKIVVMPYGSDSQIFERTPNKLTVNALCLDYPDFFQKYHGLIKSNVTRWSKHSNIVIGTMDSIDYMFYWNRIRHCHFAIDTNKIQPVYVGSSRKSIKILHAPNHKEIKGTKYIEQAIYELKAEGYSIEYVFIQNLPNNEFIKMVQSADIVVDQLVMGWYAMFAMEAMAAGKTTICYLRKDLVELYECAGCIEKDEIPLINANIYTIKEVLKNLIDNRDNLKDIGRASREYVEKYHSLDAIGDFFDEINKSLGIEI